MAELVQGLAGVVAAESTIAKIDGENGFLAYRGYAIEDLAAGATFEEVVYLLWHGELPSRKQLDRFRADLGREARLPDGPKRALEALPKGTDAMAALRTGVSAVPGPEGEEAFDRVKQRSHAMRLLVALPAVAAWWAGRRELDLKGKGFAAAVLEALRGEKASAEEARVFDACLVLHADHGFNASTFSARVTCSTLAGMTAAVTTAIGTLSGPLHGGANRRVIEMLESMGTPEGGERKAMELLSRKEKVWGFGHRVYKVMDPRARILRAHSERLAKVKGDRTFFEICQRLEQVMEREKHLFPNVDFYSGTVYRNLGVSKEFYTPIFAIARVSGWLAHVMEQYADNKLIRPRAKYVGPEGRILVPLETRKDASGEAFREGERGEAE